MALGRKPGNEVLQENDGFQAESKSMGETAIMAFRNMRNLVLEELMQLSEHEL